MSNVVGIKGCEPDPWNEIMAAGALATLRKVLASSPVAIVIAYETKGDGPKVPGEYMFQCYPPGNAAGFYIMKRLSEDAINDEE
jgi:hypothetical protein